MHTVLSSMNGYISLPSILNKIVKDHGKDEFGDFKTVILGMLDTYTYEDTILKIANKLVLKDSYTAYKEFIKSNSKGIR